MNSKVVTVNQNVLAERRREAETLRRKLTSCGTLVVNLVSSPGAGKTTLLQAMAKHWANRLSMAVLVGDLATERDAERLRPFVPVEQLTTGGACHLELSLVKQGLEKLPNQHFDFLFIENVGNLVCPASHDLAEHLRMVLLSTTEGDDKPGKYPKMFRTSQLMVISKTDLLPHVPFQSANAASDARLIQPEISVYETCALTGSGISELCTALEHLRQSHVNQPQTSTSVTAT
jgi:hydrogenase nickel incorporation protein HypB